MSHRFCFLNMTTLDGFYKVTATERDESNVVVRLRLDAAHPIYEGHFPGQPVAPGAALTQMVVDEAIRIIGGKLTFAGARQIKFLSVTDPNKVEELELRYTFVERDGSMHFTCTGINGETIFLKMNGELL